MKTVFFGSGEYTIPVIKMMQSHGLELVITTESKGKFIDFLDEHSIPFISTHLKNAKDIEQIRSVGAEVAVLASYGAIIPQKVIDIFRRGILNIHPSLLPIYKGPSPVQYAIRNGDTMTGVTVIRLDDQIDHGPILAQKEYELTRKETLEELKNTLFKIGAEMIEDILTRFENNRNVIEQDQNHRDELFTYKITREDGKIDLKKIPHNLDNLIRAYYPWPGVWFETKFMGKIQRFKLLPGNMIQIEGKKAMPYKDFTNGYGTEGEKIIHSLSQ